MIDSSVIEGTDIVTVTYDGAVGADDVEDVRTQLASVSADRGSAKLLVEVGDIDPGRVEPKAVWEDLKALGTLDDLTRLAVVTDKGLLQTAAEKAGSLVDVDVEVFDADRRDEALVWLRS